MLCTACGRAPEIRRYFRAADPAFFDRRSLRILSDTPASSSSA